MKSIREWLGHSTFATTADTYSHLDISSKQESAKAISDTTINNWVVAGKIQAVNYYGKNLISKESLAKYLASVEGQCNVRPSQKHQDLRESFMDREQKSGMVFGSMTL
jgi:hypothetical protein